MAKINRFSAGLSETLVGPGIGGVLEFLELALKARDSAASVALGGEPEITWAELMNFGLYNNPVFPVNLFYVKPALDYLIINSMREAASPGYMKRSLRSARKVTGNKNLRYWNRVKKDGGIW